MPDASLQQTPLHDVHLALGAKMVPFAGYEMPIQYTGILDEHAAVREAAGLFDVSHMGEFELRGPGALALAQRLVTNDVGRLADGQAQYAVLCAPDGTAIDDLLVYRFGPDHVMLVVNASNIDVDWAHVQAVHADGGFDCELRDVSRETALLALQGPRAFDVFASATGLDASDIPYYHFRRPEPGALLGAERAVISHTGYTGERGLELYCEPRVAVRLWEALMAAGAEHGLRPAGLGARDTLRLEAGYCLYGHELDRETTPYEAGLGWIVKPDAADFVGREALVQQKADGVPRRLVGFVVRGRGIPRQGMELATPDGTVIGAVTSGSQSPALSAGIGLGYVPNDPAYTAPGTELALVSRGRRLPVEVRKPPFHTTD